MLLDKYVLTKGLTTLYSKSPTAASASETTKASFVKRVNQSMARLDPLLKTLQVRPSPAEGLVQAYLIHIGDRSDMNFRKILDLKGVRKQDQPSLVELFGVHRDGKTNEQLMPLSPLLSPLMNPDRQGLGINAAVSGAASGMASMPTQFDPTRLGESVFRAARDGLERMATPVGGVGAGERVSSPLGEDSKATMEGNLKAFGKFFKRDMSGFGVGRFGGRREGSVDDTMR